MKKANSFRRITLSFLSFIYNSLEMTMLLTDTKKSSIIKQILVIQKKNSVKTRDLAKLIGMLVATCPTVSYSWMHITLLEREKCLTLKAHRVNYNKHMKLGFHLKPDFIWWFSNLQNSCSSLKGVQYEMEIFSDASPSVLDCAYLQ